MVNRILKGILVTTAVGAGVTITAKVLQRSGILDKVADKLVEFIPEDK